MAAADQSTSAFSRLPLSLGVAAGLLLLLVGGLRWPAVAAASFLLASAAYVGHVLAQTHSEMCAGARDEGRRALQGVAGLCSASAPVWLRQIETARTEADREVAELARHFARIAQKLDQVMEASHSAGGAEDGGTRVMAALGRAGADLDALVAALRTLQASKQGIVNGIGTEAARLKESAADIRQIALHTRMVAMNATIEAARAGEAGRPFGVIVTDMRELAARTAAASEQFSLHTDRLHAMVTAAFEEQVPGADSQASIGWAQDLARRVVDDMESMVAQLRASVAHMDAQRREVRNDVGQVLLSLQFQDRVSQILAHVAQNLEELQRVVESGAPEAAGLPEWMERMAAAYSTPEEFANLGEGHAPAAPRTPEVTFF